VGSRKEIKEEIQWNAGGNMVGDEDLDEKEVCSKRISKETYRRRGKKGVNERDERLGWRTKQKREDISISVKLTTSIHPTRSRELECLVCSGRGHMASQC